MNRWKWTEKNAGNGLKNGLMSTDRPYKRDYIYKDYKGMKKRQNLFFKNVQLRALETGDKRKVIEGVIPYNSRSVPIWGLIETIDPGAFRKTLADKKNIFAFFNHDDGKILGSTRAETLVLENTEDGLVCRCTLPGTSWGNDAWEIVNRGDANTMSFGFSPVKWRDEGKERTLLEVNLSEVSFCVPFAAYPETDSKVLRGLKRMDIDIEKINEILEKDTPTEDDIAVLKELVNTVNSVIEKNKPKQDEPKAADPGEPPEGTTRNDDTSGSGLEKEKEEIKAQIIDLIDLLFEIEKTSSEDVNTETNEG
jgi:HK97 family phage prohead protease